MQTKIRDLEEEIKVLLITIDYLFNRVMLIIDYKKMQRKL